MSLLPAAVEISRIVNTSNSGTISFDELSAYFAAVNQQYGRESDGTKEASGILKNLNPDNQGTCCSCLQFSQYLSTTFAKYPEKLERLKPLAESVRKLFDEAQVRNARMVGGVAKGGQGHSRSS